VDRELLFVSQSGSMFVKFMYLVT